MVPHVARRLEVRVDANVRRLRAFPALGEAGVTPGSRVDWDSTLGRYASRQRLRFVRVGSSGDRISATVLVGVGQQVKRGEVLAYYSYLFGLGFTEYTSPVDGEIVDINHTTGSIAIKESLLPLRSNMPGTVASADDALGVCVASHGDLVYGVVGAGYGRSGVLEVKAPGPDKEVRSSELSAKDAGKVIVAGKSVTQEFLEACLRWRVAGVVAGSIPHQAYRWYQDTATRLDWDEFLARYWARELKDKDSRVPPPTEISTALVLTEGFGAIPMNQSAFDVLSKRAGERVFIDGSGAFRSQAAGSDDTVPCVFVPQPGSAPAEDAGASLAALVAGDRVKVFGFAKVPKKAMVLELGDEDIVLETGVRVPGVKVCFGPGDERWVPLLNIEKAD